MSSSLSDHYTRPWFQYIAPPLQGLVRTTEVTMMAARQLPISVSTESTKHNIDFSFVVFPMAVAYEGFLKQFLFDLRLISREELYSRKFRIGRALNPDVRADHRNEHWLFDDVSRACTAEIARELWQTWLDCRNHLFHYFPSDYQTLDLETAEQRVLQIADIIDVTITHKWPELSSR